MKAKVLRGVRLESGTDVFPGDEIEVSEQEARVLAQRGAIQLPAPEEVPASPTDSEGKPT